MKYRQIDKAPMKSFLRHSIISILEWEAKLIVRKYKPKIIAVTGSVGKTSTKDAIFSAVGKHLVARKSLKSFNSEIGVPLTILGRDNAWGDPIRWIRVIVHGLVLILTRTHYPKWLILEIGAGKPGDIARVARFIHPNIVVMTRIGDVPAHIEFFKSPKELLEEKAEIIKGLGGNDMLVFNIDDERITSLREKTKAKSISFGFSEGAMFRASFAQVVYENERPVGTTFKLEYDGNIFPVTMKGVVGIQSVYSALAACAVGAYVKTNIVDVINALAAHKSPPGRMRIIEGIKGSTVIDDTYNSSPVAAHAALDTFNHIVAKGRKIAILGDMLELGKFTIGEHTKLGTAAAFLDLLIVVGPRAKYVAEGALNGGLSEKNIIELDDAQSAGKYLEHILHDGDLVLIKSSQVMRMERAVLEIMEHPEYAQKLLVRQEEEWKGR